MNSVYFLSNVFSVAQVQQVRSQLTPDVWEDGRLTASGMAQTVKNNHQIDVGKIPGLTDMLGEALLRLPLFQHLTMPRAVSRLLVSRYGEGMAYGTHTDAAIMNTGNRSDISFTLFLTDPQDYDGGDLSLETSFGEQRVKLTAGSAIVYPTGGLHQVLPVTRGERLVVVGWVQSRIRDPRKREIILDLDQVRQAYLAKQGHDRMADLLLKASTNLRRMWDE